MLQRSTWTTWPDRHCQCLAESILAEVQQRDQLQDCVELHWLFRRVACQATAGLSIRDANQQSETILELHTSRETYQLNAGLPTE